ncbi:hypothetical protein EXN66_Car002711 [Channa argus]|uniref:Uncharacterized protein n=1 Tax=Channa argus TaxID=215402 RepID=A0A6G1PA01_CHAAH|nr:hypothetical protein EXN66_Car002711 [Channa argus]
MRERRQIVCYYNLDPMYCAWINRFVDNLNMTLDQLVLQVMLSLSWQHSHNLLRNRL